MTNTLEITQVKSAIGYNQKQKDTIKALGLKKLNHTVTHIPTPAILGMVNKVKHLIKTQNKK